MTTPKEEATELVVKKKKLFVFPLSPLLVMEMPLS